MIGGNTLIQFDAVITKASPKAIFAMGEWWPKSIVEFAPKQTEMDLCDSPTPFGNSLHEITAPAWIARKKGCFSEAFLESHVVGKATTPTPPPHIENLGDMSGLIALFKTAKSNTSHPKITLSVAGVTVVLRLAGPKSKNAGSVTVTGTGPFETRPYFGRVSPDGGWFPSLAPSNADSLPLIEDLLHQFSVDAEATAAAYGKTSGHCCFCHRKLTDEKSIHVGYGPVCAKNYGLAWGDVS